MKKFRSLLMLALVVMIFASVSVMSVAATKINTGEVTIQGGYLHHWYLSSEGNTSNGWTVTKGGVQKCYIQVGQTGYSMEIGLFYRPTGATYMDFFEGSNTSKTINKSFTSDLDTALYRPCIQNNSTVSMTVLSSSYFTLV